MREIVWTADGERDARKWLASSGAALQLEVLRLLDTPQADRPSFHVSYDRGIALIVMVPTDGAHYFIGHLRDA